MKRFLSKKLPAFLLAVTMLAGTMPLALAAHSDSDQVASAWTQDSASHWHACSCGEKINHAPHEFQERSSTPPSGSSTPPSCYEKGTRLERCRVCGYEQTVTLNPTGNHIFDARNWASDNDNHWHRCKTTGCTATSDKARHTPKGEGTVKNPTCTSAGSVTYVCEICGKSYSKTGSPAMGHSYKDGRCIRCGARQSGSSSSSSDETITYKVKAGSSVELSRSHFKDLYEDAYSDDFLFVSFEPGSSYKSSYGLIYYDYEGKDQEKFDRDDLEYYDYYYSDSDYGEYPIRGLRYVSAKDAGERTVRIPMILHGEKHELEATLEFRISKNGGSSSKDADLVYDVDLDDEITLRAKDFRKLFDEKWEDEDTFEYLVFDSYDRFDDYGYFQAEDEDGDSVDLDEDELEDGYFYYKESNISGSDEYDLDTLTFVTYDDADEDTLTFSFTLYGEDGSELEGELAIRIGDAADDDEDVDKGDIDWVVEAGDEFAFDRSDFKEFFEDEYSKDTLRYVVFSPDSSYKSSNGVLYYDYDGKDEEEFSKSDLEDTKFYYSSSKYGDYPLDELTFVADDDFDSVVTLEFRAYGDKEHLDGTLTLRSKDTEGPGKSQGNILYSTTYSGSVRINHNDFARFFKKHFPSSTLEYVKITQVPTSGSLYYDYYNTSKYGSKVRLSADNCRDYTFHFSPDSTKEYALSELSFTPNGFNYCPSISFTAYGSGSKSVSGTILISITLSSVPEVYGATPKGTDVAFPASPIAKAVSTGTGLSLGSIRLLELPDASAGTIYVGSGTSVKADTSTQYRYSGGGHQISSLRFVPARNFTGSVEIPYAAYNTSGNLVATGRFSLGVVKAVPKFKDVTSSTWCYKYVVEMNDAGVIDGYQDGSFRPDKTVTYGQALKLIMLAAGYQPQKATGAHWASGYLSQAKRDNLISGSVNLDAPIPRLAVAQIAAKAMKLSTSDLSSVKPFTDTSDIYVQALSAAGIVQGYFSNGTSTWTAFQRSRGCCSFRPAYASGIKTWVMWSVSVSTAKSFSPITNACSASSSPCSRAKASMRPYSSGRVSQAPRCHPHSHSPAG